MEITPQLIYWITRVDEIKSMLDRIQIPFYMFGMMGTLGLILWVVLKRCNDEDIANVPRFVYFVGPVLLVIGMFISALHMMIPTTKDIAAIIVVPAIVNNEKVKELPSRFLDLGNAWLEELKPKKRGESND